MFENLYRKLNYSVEEVRNEDYVEQVVDKVFKGMKKGNFLREDGLTLIEVNK